MIKDELKKFPPGCIGGKFEFIKVPNKNKINRCIFYFEEGIVITRRKLKSKLDSRGLTIKEWLDYHYLPRDENGNYIYPKCRYCNDPAEWRDSGFCYLPYCTEHHDKYFSDIQRERAINQHKKYGNLTNDLDSFIKRHGEVLGRLKYENYCKSISRSRTLDGMIENHGEIEGRKKYEKMCNDISYTHSYKGHIELYGKEEGERRYKNTRDKHRYSLTEGGMIDKYGIEDGKRRFNKTTLNRLSDKKIKPYIDKYGEENALYEYYKDIERYKSRMKYSSVSYISIQVFKSLIDRLWYFLNPDDVFYGDNESRVRTGPESGDIGFLRRPDFLIKSKKIIIEFQGDYWHKRPKDINFKYDDITDKMYLKIRNDYYKLKAYRNLGYYVFYIHEGEYRRNPDLILEECIKFITNESFRNEYTNMLDSVL